jgi:uncharacterized protein YkwD
MKSKDRIWFFIGIALLVVWSIVQPDSAYALPQLPGQSINTPSQLIEAVNSLRLSRGLSALTVHPALMQSAQSQADYMAGTGIVTHDRPGTTYTQQLIALGFPLAGDLSLGGLRSENILEVSSPLVWNGVPAAWQDDQHMNTILSPSYTHIGAGISQHGGLYFYALDAAAATGSGQMQDQASVILTSVPEGSNVTGVSQYIIPVEINTAQPNGDVIHVVEYGQTLWAIAVQYGTKIKELQALNNLGDSVVVQQGQKLLVKRGATQPAPLPSATSTPLTVLTIATPLLPSPTALAPFLTTTPTENVPVPSNSGSSKLLVGILIIAAFVGGGVAVWLIRDPN